MAVHTAQDCFVIGVDFGTTFSGVASAYSGLSKPVDNIQVIKAWPGGNGITSDKVPSEFAYGPREIIKPAANKSSRSKVSSSSRSTPRGRQKPASLDLNDLSTALRNTTGSEPDDAGASSAIRWGYQLRADEVRLRCIKLFLDSEQEIPDYVSRKDTSRLLRDSKKDPKSAVADYLTELFRHARQTLASSHSEYFISTTRLEIVMTVPAIWSDAAKDATLKAAQKAGKAFDPCTALNVRMISEPEAAAVYTLQSMQSTRTWLRKNDTLIVCDAGGGTVDLISYEILQLAPLRLQESTEGTGKCCGSAFINMRFEEYVRRLLGPATFVRASRGWLSALQFFEENVKRKYDHTQPQAFNIPFPVPRDVAVSGIEDGFLALSSEVVKEFFRPSIQDITGLIEEQMRSLNEKGKSVAGILLVGGFGQSTCLYKCLQWSFGNQSYSEQSTRGGSTRRAVHVIQPEKAWTAVVQGAVLRGLEGGDSSVISRIARQHYGVRCRTHFDSSIHPMSIREWDPLDERWHADNRISWYIRKGQTVSSKDPVIFGFNRKFRPHEAKSCIEPLIVCTDDYAPGASEANTALRTATLCNLPVDLGKVPREHWQQCRNSQGEAFERLQYQLGMQIESGILTFDLRVAGRVYGTVRQVFE